MWDDSDTTRRGVLRLSGAAAAGGLAGCTGLLGSSSDDTSGDESGTEGPSTPDDPPTEFTDDFGEGSLEGYRVLSGERSQWGVEERIDGTSAHASAAGEYGNTLLAPAADRFRWTGTGEIALDVQVRAAAYNRNAVVEFGDPDGDTWRVKVAFTGRQIKIRSPSDRVENTRATPDPADSHRLGVSVTTDAVTVSLDEVERIEFADPPSLPSGTVGFGIGSNDSKGGQTWFDDARFRSG